MRVALTAAFLLSGLTAIQVAPALAAPAQDPSGTWLTGDGRAKVRIDRCGPAGANICGKVVWLKSPNTEDGTPRTDIKNPDPKKRGRPALGGEPPPTRAWRRKPAGSRPAPESRSVSRTGP